LPTPQPPAGPRTTKATPGEKGYTDYPVRG